MSDGWLLRIRSATVGWVLLRSVPFYKGWVTPLRLGYQSGTLPKVMRKSFDPESEFTWKPTRDGKGVWVERPIPGHPRWNVAGLFLERGGQVTLAELRVFPDAGRYRADRGARAQTFQMGNAEWTIGPVETARSGGEWSRKAEDLRKEHEGGIAARILRDIPVRTLIDEVHQKAAAADAAKLPKGWDRAVRQQPARPGRAGRDLYFYAVWARRLEALAGSGSPIKDLAQKYGETYGAVQGWIYKARRKGLLTETVGGRGGGMLTPKAMSILDAYTAGPTTKRNTSTEGGGEDG